MAKLSKRAARQETGLFLLEGPQAAREALAWAPETVLELYGTPTALEKHTDVRDAAVDADVDVQYTTEAVLDAIGHDVGTAAAAARGLGELAAASKQPALLGDFA